MVRTWADVSLAERELGYRPKVDIAAGIPRFVRWWLNEHQGQLKELGLRAPTLPYGAPGTR